MADLYIAKNKLKLVKLAQKIVKDFYMRDYESIGEHPKFRWLKHLEQEHEQHDYPDQLNSFAIKLTDIPYEHYQLMLALGWLDEATHKPINYSDGFYEAYTAEMDKKPLTLNNVSQTSNGECYIAMTNYVKLLLIEIDLKNLFTTPQVNSEGSEGVIGDITKFKLP